jgi:hypothetical protein
MVELQLCWAGKLAVEDDETAGCMEQDDGRNVPAAGAVFLEVLTAWWSIGAFAVSSYLCNACTGLPDILRRSGHAALWRERK